MVHVGRVVARVAVGGAQVGVGRARVVVNPVPAGRQPCGRVPVVEVVYERQRVLLAGRRKVEQRRVHRPAPLAVGRYAHLVARVGRQPVKGVVGRRAVLVFHNPGSRGARAVLHAPRRLLVARHPSHCGLCGVVAHHVGRGGYAGGGAVARHAEHYVGSVRHQSVHAAGTARRVESRPVAVVEHSAVARPCRAVAVEVRRAVARTRRLVHDGRNHYVRHPVPLERAGEPVVHRARRVERVRAAVVAVCQVYGVVVVVAAAGVRAAPCSVEVYVETFGVARVCRPCKGAARNVARRKPQVVQLRGGVYALAERVAVARAHRHAAILCAVRARGAAVAAAQAPRRQACALPVGVGAVVAHPAHPHRVGGVGRQPAKQVPLYGVRLANGARASRLFYLQLVVRRPRQAPHAAPSHHGRRARNALHRQGARRRAGRHLAHHDVVEVKIVGLRPHRDAESYVVARAAVAVKRYYVGLKHVGRRRCKGRHARKGRVVRRVGHHSHLKVAIRGAGAHQVKAHHQVVHPVLYRRHSQVAVIACRAVEIHRVSAARPVAAAGVGVGGARVVRPPAVARANAVRRAAARRVLKAIAVGQVASAYRAALRAHAYAVAARRVALAQAVHVYVRQRPRRQPRKRIGRVVGRNPAARALRKAARSVLYQVYARLVRVHPVKVHAAARNVARPEVSNPSAVGYRPHPYVVQIAVVGAAARPIQVYRHIVVARRRSGEVRLEILPLRPRGVRQCAQRVKGRRVVGVAHSAHHKTPRVRGRRPSAVKRYLQPAQRVLQARRHHIAPLLPVRSQVEVKAARVRRRRRRRGYI